MSNSATAVAHHIRKPCVSCCEGGHYTRSRLWRKGPISYSLRSGADTRETAPAGVAAENMADRRTSVSRADRASMARPGFDRRDHSSGRCRIRRSGRGGDLHLVYVGSRGAGMDDIRVVGPYHVPSLSWKGPKAGNGRPAEGGRTPATECGAGCCPFGLQEPVSGGARTVGRDSPETGKKVPSDASTFARLRPPSR